MVICAQMKILNDSLVNMRQFATREMRIGRHCRNIDGRIMPELQNIMNKKLVEFVIHHRCILDFADEVTHIFTTSILGQFAVSAIIICTTLFEMSLSSKLTTCAYHSDWRDCSQEFKRNLLFFMIRSQRALKLYAGGFFTLSLDTFVKVSSLRMQEIYLSSRFTFESIAVGDFDPTI
ncbi:hypothetical protein JTB14_030524 [Gonioctena quinquepunctata]|nr:hypothetical protein JTB14_030524 [Gonioctena quinquepunctata]